MKSQRAEPQIANPQIGKIGSGQEGFSLIEVLVSLMVAMLIISAVVHALGSTWAGAKVTSHKSGAVLLARALLERTRSSSLDDAMLRSGDIDGYKWRITIRPIPLPPRPAQTSSAQTSSNGQDDTKSQSNSAQKGADNDQTQLDLFDVLVEVTSSGKHHERLEELMAQPSRSPAPSLSTWAP